MNNWTRLIHCHTQSGWNRSKDIVTRLARQQPETFSRIRAVTLEITSIVEKLSPIAQKVCWETCVSCKDVCCKRATIWYDIKDLLYLYCSGNSVPKRQIQKKDINGELVCPNFTVKGCALPRTQRPFVCSWYFCTSQKEYLEKNNPDQLLLIKQYLTDFKSLRNQILSEFKSINQR